MKFAVAVGRINKQWNEAELNVSQKNFLLWMQSLSICSILLLLLNNSLEAVISTK